MPELDIPFRDVRPTVQQGILSMIAMVSGGKVTATITRDPDNRNHGTLRLQAEAGDALTTVRHCIRSDEFYATRFSS